MDSLDAITLMYLSKHWDGHGTLLDCAHKFQQTRDELNKLLNAEKDKSLLKALDGGTFSM